MSELLTHCRLCAGTDLRETLNLGTMALAGTFPATLDEDAALERGPIQLVRCADCGLAQLGSTFDLKAQFGSNYGYRSGLNNSMVRHLRDIARRLRDYVPDNGRVLDIGSNDGTLLRYLAPPGVEKYGVDPTAGKFRAYYDADVTVVEDFFRAGQVPDCNVITSVACFYDLPDPLQFAKDVASTLRDEYSVWFCEVAYVGDLVKNLTYDGICHEHLEYYGVKQILNILDRSGLTLVDFGFNDTNGGSLWFMARWRSVYDPAALWPVADLEDKYLDDGAWGDFARCVSANRLALTDLLHRYRREGKRVFGLGASTKGNVLLQYCGIGPDLIEAIAEVNPDKFGKLTPGSRIPIISEAGAAAQKPDAYLVLPWHFRAGFEARQNELKADLIFPLPEVEVVKYR